MPLPTQNETEVSKPETHLAWTLHNIPTIAGFGAITNPHMLLSWAQHLWRCGVAHRDYLVTLADEDGNIHVSKLPKQQIEFHKAIRGPYSHYNQAARWVEVGTEAPEPMVVQDPADLTQQEQQAVAERLIEIGAIQPPKPVLPTAEVFED